MRQSTSNERRALRPSYAAKNAFGIPDLIRSLIATEPPATMDVYRAGKNVATDDSALCFFVDDYRFQCAWSYPQRMVDSLLAKGWQTVCEPDFSMWADRPLAEQIHAVYQARWCARHWQEYGLSIIPCPNWSTRSTYEFAWLGIPRGSIVAVEARSCEPRWWHRWQAGFDAMLRALDPSIVLLYGDTTERVKAPSQLTVHRYAAITETRRASLNAKRVKPLPVLPGQSH